MSGIWVVVPLKPLSKAKSRLSPILSPEQRERLAELLFRRVLAAAQDAPQVAGTLVISRDMRALAIAREYGARTMQESGAPELNAALMRATSLIATWRGKGVLILPADLPLIAREDVSDMVLASREGYSMVIATDRSEDGTNALLTRPAGLIEYAYGIGSFQRHIALAEAAGAHVHIHHSDRLALDIDVAEDLAYYESLVDDSDGVRRAAG